MKGKAKGRAKFRVGQVVCVGERYLAIKKIKKDVGFAGGYRVEFGKDEALWSIEAVTPLDARERGR